MRWLMLLMLLGCEPVKLPELKPGDCVSDPSTGIWKLMRREEEKHFFVRYPLSEGAAVEMIEELSTLKKVECP